jgi:murein L,D-transpeptidase YafK
LDWQRHETSNFHSFYISYPNALDSARAKTKGLKPGSNIMVHGTPKRVKEEKRLDEWMYCLK